MVVMERFYAAEAAYVAAGGHGRADYAPVAALLDPATDGRAGCGPARSARARRRGQRSLEAAR
ncbi:hypothetical protein [Nonomuraea sp. NPDC049607]|uniref:hypothetical protein n=1 Tax=Nonomuraea sp. NPDC049607 TaxID=3154732 RepID=UPI00342FBBDF